MKMVWVSPMQDWLLVQFLGAPVNPGQLYLKKNSRGGVEEGIEGRWGERAKLSYKGKTK